MLEVTGRRLDKARLMDRVELYCGDAASLPHGDKTFDPIFMSFTLELFDTADIPMLLREVKRVLKPGGRIAAASMSKANGKSLLPRLYEWVHRRWPKYVDCRPIYLEQSLGHAACEIRRKKGIVRLFGLPAEIVVAIKQS
jgi:demethylmenaquinone methyltransferase/2-methoxy-6-polyprenyl-1,4-benzoquinol methylase